MKHLSCLLSAIVLSGAVNAQTYFSTKELPYEGSSNIMSFEPACGNIQYRQTGLTVPQWFLQQAKPLDMPYPPNTQLRPIAEPQILLRQSHLTGTQIPCQHNAEAYLQSLDEAVEENRRHQGEAGYIPYDTTSFIQEKHKQLMLIKTN
ncbi:MULTISPECIES: hypothetical protein [Eikenella]|uniref:Uncharacterized protein n=1 Tax=Eikenella longinqua TaxID=1795827 RepID=A0A1A9RWA3_9NEIS|nr:MULTISPECIES: hypothetical protein [Eikenella]OAM26733.1 hypothetical protein A7P95_08195 [Eikenella longinqua]